MGEQLFLFSYTNNSGDRAIFRLYKFIKALQVFGSNKLVLVRSWTDQNFKRSLIKDAITYKEEFWRLRVSLSSAEKALSGHVKALTCELRITSPILELL